MPKDRLHQKISLSQVRGCRLPGRPRPTLNDVAVCECKKYHYDIKRPFRHTTDCCRALCCTHSAHRKLASIWVLNKQQAKGLSVCASQQQYTERSFMSKHEAESQMAKQNLLAWGRTRSFQSLKWCRVGCATVEIMLIYTVYYTFGSFDWMRQRTTWQCVMMDALAHAARRLLLQSRYSAVRSLSLFSSTVEISAVAGLASQGTVELVR